MTDTFGERRWSPRARRVLGVVVGAFLALRVAVLFTSIETVAHEEELYRGTIARELSVGLKVPLWDYQADHYQEGSLVVGLLAAPLFRLAGSRLLVLKAVPLLFALGTLLAVAAFLHRNFGERAALVGATLYVFTPPGPTRLSLLAMGFHTESVLLAMLVLACWYQFAFGASRQRLWLLLFGLCAGLGFSFTYITAIATLGCLSSWPFLRRRRQVAADAACLILGLAVGLAPWLAYNLTHDFAGLRFLLGVFAGPPGDAISLVVRPVRKVGAIFVFGLPLGYGFAPIAGSALSYAYWALIAAAVGSLAIGGPRDAKLVPLALASGVLVAAYALSRFDVPRNDIPFSAFRFLYPLHFLVLLLAAVGVSRFRRAVPVTVVLLLLGAIGQAEALFHDPAPRVTDYRAYSYVELGKVWQDRRYPGSLTFSEAQPLLRRFPVSERRAIYRGLVAFGASRWSDPAASLRRIGEVDDEYRVFLAQAVGQALGVTEARDSATLAELTAALPADERDHFEFGYSVGALVRAGTGRQAVQWAELAAHGGGRWPVWAFGVLVGQRCYEKIRESCPDALTAIAALPTSDQVDAFRGLGQVLGMNWVGTGTIDPDRVGDSVLPVEHRADVAWGIGWGLREAFSEDRLRVLDWIDRLPRERRPAALEGVRSCDTWYRLERAP